MATISEEMVQKSLHAAIAAIEIYNKPDFHYREESFSLLMVNSWELLLKAKWLLDHKEDITSIYAFDQQNLPKKNRSGNFLTYSISHLAMKLLEDNNSGMTKPCCDNIMALIEIRDNSAHLINKDLYLGRRILEIGTATLQNYLNLCIEWFQVDLSRYNFFLMPLSFYHGFESLTSFSISNYSEQIQRLLLYLDKLEEIDRQSSNESNHHFALRLETKLVRDKSGASPLAFRLTDDPSAPIINIREEDVLKNYPLTYKQLTDTLKRRYSDFLQNKRYHDILRPLKKEKRYCFVRLLHPGNPGSTKQKFYNPNIIQEFDQYYEKRTKA